MDNSSQHDENQVMEVAARSMPWLISLFFHVGVAMVFLFLVMIVQAEGIEERAFIPSAVFNENTGGSISFGKTNKVNNTTQHRVKVRASGDSEKDLENLYEGKTGEVADLIGTSGGGNEGGTLADYGKGKGGKGIRSSLYGLRGNAHHIIYLIDRSGSMFDSFEAVKFEICRSVADLRPEQDFHVIMFADGRPLEKRPMDLTHPTDKHKIALAGFLKGVKAENTTNPVMAIHRAFNVLSRANRNPGKLIYMLTDGAFPDNEAVLAAIRARNGRKDVLINTFLYGWKPPVAEKVMIKIADDNGGNYRYISPDE